MIKCAPSNVKLREPSVIKETKLTVWMKKMREQNIIWFSIKYDMIQIHEHKEKLDIFFSHLFILPKPSDSRKRKNRFPTKIQHSR